MAHSMENPGFVESEEDSVVDLPGMESNASMALETPTAATLKSSRRSCPSCHGRMSVFRLDRHSV